MKMVVKQAVTIKIKRFSFFQIAKSSKESGKVIGFLKNILPVVTTIDHVINEVRIDRAQGTGHTIILAKRWIRVNLIVLTLYFLNAALRQL